MRVRISCFAFLAVVATSAFSAVEQQPPWDRPTHYRGFTFQPWLKRGKGTDPYNTTEPAGWCDDILADVGAANR